MRARSQSNIHDQDVLAQSRKIRTVETRSKEEKTAVNAVLVFAVLILVKENLAAVSAVCSRLLWS